MFENDDDMKVISLFQRGQTATKIASALNICNTRVSFVIRKHYDSNRVKKSLLHTDPVFLSAIKDAFDTGKSITDIATSFGQRSDTIRRLLPEAEDSAEIRHTNDLRLEALIGLTKEGKTLEEAGLELGITRERVRQILISALGQRSYEILSVEGQANRTSVVNQQFVELARQGETDKELAKKFAISESYVASKLRSHMQTEEFKEWKSLCKEKRTDPKHEEMVNKHQKVVSLIRQGKTIKEVAILTGYSRAGVIKVSSRYLSKEERANIHRKRREKRREKHDISEEVRAKVIEMVRGVVVYRKIAETLNLSESAVCSIALSIQSSERRRIRLQKMSRFSETEKDSIVDAFRNGESIKSLANLHGCTTNPINKAIDENMTLQERADSMRRRRERKSMDTMRKSMDTILSEVRSEPETFDNSKSQLAIQLIVGEDGGTRIRFATYIDNKQTNKNLAFEESQVQSTIQRAIKMGIIKPASGI